MKKKIFYIPLFLLFFVFNYLFVFIKTGEIQYEELSSSIILDNGKIKSIISINNENTLLFNKARYKKQDISIALLPELYLNQKTFYCRNIFYIDNLDIVSMLKLPKRKNHFYSFSELNTAFNLNIQFMYDIRQIDINNRTDNQNQLIELYSRILYYFEIGHSSSLLNNEFVINNIEISTYLMIQNNKYIAYFDVLKNQYKLLKTLKYLQKKDHGNFSINKYLLINLISSLQNLSQDSKIQSLRLIPDKDIGIFISLWQISYNRNFLNNNYNIYIFKNLINNYMCCIQNTFYKYSLLLKEFSFEMYNIKKVTALELFIKKCNLSTISLFIYIITFLLSVFLFLRWGKIYNKKSFLLLLLIIGNVCHFLDIIIKCYIFDRPPVTNLYESVVFVSCISVGFFIILEYKLNNFICIISGALMGSIFQIVANKYQVNINNIGVLQAAINTNFWLIIHVLTMSIGYSLCFLISILCYFYLFYKTIQVKNINFTNKIVKNILFIAVLSISICCAGTILGGMWADQSWGRFWGWDPKENGALLIIIWLILLLHLFISKYLSLYTFCISLIFTKIIVLLSWFGVNLLDAGLHSYGLIQHFKESMLSFFIIDIFFILLVFLILEYKKFFLTKNNII